MEMGGVMDGERMSVGVGGGEGKVGWRRGAVWQHGVHVWLRREGDRGE